MLAFCSDRGDIGEVDGSLTPPLSLVSLLESEWAAELAAVAVDDFLRVNSEGIGGRERRFDAWRRRGTACCTLPGVNRCAGLPWSLAEPNFGWACGALQPAFSRGVLEDSLGRTTFIEFD